jgi:hypothetical protein
MYPIYLYSAYIPNYKSVNKLSILEDTQLRLT